MTSLLYWACPLQGHMPLPGTELGPSKTLAKDHFPYTNLLPPPPCKSPSLYIFPSLHITSAWGPDTLLLSQQRDSMAPEFLMGGGKS